MSLVKLKKERKKKPCGITNIIASSRLSPIRNSLVLQALA